MPVSAIFGRKVIQQLETFKEIPQEQYDRDSECFIQILKSIWREF